jgi:hypothetical protein
LGASYLRLEIIAKLATVLEVEPAELLRVPALTPTAALRSVQPCNGPLRRVGVPFVLMRELIEPGKIVVHLPHSAYWANGQSLVLSLPDRN